MAHLLLAVMLVMAGWTDLLAQAAGDSVTTRAGRRPVPGLVEEIALAKSAAPASISAEARVMVLTDSGYVVGDPGNSSVTCVVNRSWTHSVEPHCYDAEGARTVMLIELRRNFLRHSGKTEADIAAEIGRGLASGIYRLPSRPALTYMMSPRQVLYGDNGKRVGKWRPHLMVYFPYMTDDSVGFPSRPEMSVGMVAGSGGAESSLMIIMPAFADAATSRKP